MDYAIYKGIRGAAWHCLIDCGVNKLPIPVGKLLGNYGIDIKINSEVHILEPWESGRIVSINKTPYIIMQDGQSQQRLRFTAMHELGHYLLGHLGDDSRELSRSHIKAPQEQEADMFAARVLMPSCVLWALGLEDALEISIACNVSYQAGIVRAKRMAVLRSRNKFLTDPLERRVYEQFKPYIDSVK